MSLSSLQQHLFSYFSLISVSSIDSTLKVFEEIINKSELNVPCTSEQLSKEISQINKIIQNYDLEIVSTVDEITCEKLYILVNTTDNAISQNTKFYDEHTSQFFSIIVKDCVLSEEGNLSETYCLNLNSQVKITKSVAQSILQKLISEKWLVSANDRISLGMRTIAELEQNIKQHYPDSIKNCPFCKLIVIQGHICNHCGTKCHLACLKKYLSLSRSSYTCPNCKEELEDVPVSKQHQETFESDEDSTLNKGPPKKRKKKINVIVDSD